MTIELSSAGTFEKLLPLIDAYQCFYRATPDRERNRAFFFRFLDGQNPKGVQFVALDESNVVGFATLYFHPSSISATDYAVMNDLYCLPERRGSGIGRALIQHCAAHAKSLGFSHLEWQTEKNNETAQHLYDTFAGLRSQWLLYSLPLQ